jgi:hypothetical protein
MRKKVKLSTWSTIMTLIGLIVLLAAFCFAKDSLAKYIVVGALVVLCFTALCYMPLSISVKNGVLNINRPLKIKSIPLSLITSVELYSPTMASIRICGSGGWFGYYGWFKEPSIGKYFAYYGKASDCFLVTLKDGKKYVLGCEAPNEIVEYINKHIK